ncbi:multidrug effflux MFS transporter [Sulfurisoma sediminicola]|uniref:Bcr/CflA family efflux transporter n=1 Tax=Sulfurisoma sediminicola TaxID=1381557 RepID=A0A497X7D8_9PROT|nr:multidrug effflux MFS transporter [Sulfurisoma sediminicola]RLJ61442.1 DHA1 family bicyclomycin/chloramphenicol resistance-like MFS transporter [Sulfurisoma sediminicola]
MSPTTLLLLITGCLMLQPLSTDLYLASLPHLTGYFDATPAAVQQTLSLFVVGFGVAQLASGPLSDRYGRRPVLLAGLGIYIAASIACGLAISLPMLILARFVQAVGCCTAVVVARATIRDAYPPAEGARMIAKALSLLSAAPLLGPMVGAYLQVSFGWRAAFAVHAAFAAFVMFASVRWLVETNEAKNPAATRLRPLLATYGRIATHPGFWAYALPGSLSYAHIFVFISGSSFALIRVLGVPTEYFGYCFAFGVAGFLGGTVVCRRLLARIGIERTLTVGAMVALTGGLGFLAAVLAGIHHWAVVVLAQFLTMGAHGINFPATQAGSAAPFPREAGSAAGLFGFFTQVGALVTGTWVGMSHDGTLLPLATISATTGLLLFAGAGILHRHRNISV